MNRIDEIRDMMDVLIDTTPIEINQPIVPQPVNPLIQELYELEEQ